MYFIKHSSNFDFLLIFFIHCFRYLSPGTCGENKKDSLGISKGGLRTCLLDYPTGAYYNTSDIEKGANPLFPDSDKELLFGHEEPYPKEMLTAMYGNLDHYKELVMEHTKEQISKGFIVKEDLEDLVNFAVTLAKKRGLD